MLWWIRKCLVLAAVTLACAFGLAVFGLSTPEPVAAAALGPDWQCSRLVFVFTTCSRTKQTQATPVRIANIPACLRQRT